jgi:acetylornithine deacetylase/succinyl-diaminopimelate desuccinylase-like protein
MKMLWFVVAGLSLLLQGNRLLAQENQKPPALPASTGFALARDLLRELVAIDTTPAKGSTKAALAMAARLRAAGFAEADVLLLGPRLDRQNLVVRLRGRTRAKPILLIAHLDVVEAPRDGWSEGLDPFRLTERDGYFYGRGVIDDKNAVAGLVATFIRLRAEGFVPNRDILVAFTADEETGDDNGVEWLLAEHHDLMDVAFCLNPDAGGGSMENGRRVRLTVQTSEKTYLSFAAETANRGGHSSLPEKDNAIYRLAAGLARLAQYEFPFRFNETTRAYFARLSTVETGAVAADMRAVAKEPPDLAAAKRLAAGSVFNNAILHTTCVATRLEAGHADNALPQRARAILNCRVFPGDTLEFVRSNLTAILADPGIRLIPLNPLQPGPVSPLLPEVMKPIESISQQMWPGLPVLPVMDPWASDSVHLRRAGIPTFGVSGTFSDDSANPHGANERLSAVAFDDSVEFLYRLLKVLTQGEVPGR